METQSSRQRIGIACLSGVAIVVLGLLPAQDTFPGRSFVDYVDSVSKFGTECFRDLHATIPDKNTVFSPIGVSSLFAFLREGWLGIERREEINRVFGWRPDQKLGKSHRILAARFEVLPPPPPADERRKEAEKRYRALVTERGGLPVEDFESWYKFRERAEVIAPEKLWIRNSLLFHGQGSRGVIPKSMTRAADDFGLDLIEISGEKEWKAALPDSSDIRDLLAAGAGRLLFLMRSQVHLGTKWVGNTFFLKDPWPGDFFLAAGSKVRATMMSSYPGIYPYAKTDQFEVVVMPAVNADFFVIMPAEAVTVRELEVSLARNPNLFVPLLKKTPGDVELPRFEFTCELEFRPFLENLGATSLFKSFGSPVRADWNPNLSYMLLGAGQRVSILVDQEGIQADAKTAVLGILGGAEWEEAAFHMKVNRPFVFQVRDNVTGVLLFMGAVMDPSQH